MPQAYTCSWMELEVHEVTPPLVYVDKSSESDMSTVAALSELSGSEDQTKIMLKKVIKLKRRYRGKRKPKIKENRRRARPGRSRSGFLAIGAPFNNNEFLINQNERDAMIIDGKQKCTATVMTHVKSDMDYNNEANQEQNFLHHCSDKDCATTCSEMMAKTCYGQDSSPHCTSSKSNETSDYDSLHSPSESSSGCSSHCETEHAKDNIQNDELFDIDFALRNFEADYSAHQWELKEQLITLPRQQLETRCSLLMDQLKDLEERSQNMQMMHGMSRVNELELELELLREENRRLRGVAADSLTAE